MLTTPSNFNDLKNCQVYKIRHQAVLSALKHLGRVCQMSEIDSKFNCQSYLTTTTLKIDGPSSSFVVPTQPDMYEPPERESSSEPVDTDLPYMYVLYEASVV